LLSALRDLQENGTLKPIVGDRNQNIRLELEHTKKLILPGTKVRVSGITFINGNISSGKRSESHLDAADILDQADSTVQRKRKQ